VHRLISLRAKKSLLAWGTFNKVNIPNLMGNVGHVFFSLGYKKVVILISTVWYAIYLKTTMSRMGSICGVEVNLKILMYLWCISKYQSLIYMRDSMDYCDNLWGGWLNMV
jgi:hypothetical protein